MASNSVSGSFKGIEINFTYEGPHVVMSVLNTTDEGKRLRVMFQQQPSSGRVNWTAFQLTGQVQEVVVPPEVIQSHKLAFYVDNHEPIATYTEKILEELKQIQEKYLKENPIDVSAPEVEQQTPLLSSDDKIDVLLNNHASSSEDNDIPKIDSENTTQELNQNPNVIDDVSISKDLEISPDESKSIDKSSVPEKVKYKYNNINNYVPDVNTELQFKIKVPSLPKSATEEKATFIPPPKMVPPTSKSQQKNGFLGNLAGAFGLSFANKKQYFMQLNKQLYDKFHADLEKLESDYNNGCSIPLENWDIESLSEQQTAVLLLNLMVNEVSEWKSEANKATSTKETLGVVLESIEKELKQTLKHTRGINAPSPTLFPDRTALSDKDLVRIQNDCDNYLKRFTDKLSTLEQKHAEKVRVPAFKKFLLEFVRDKLFPEVAEFSALKSVQTRLNWFLALIDYELIPIEPGTTKFSPEIHELKDICSSDFKTDTIVEVVSPGLQLKGGKRVVQNAIVIQAE